MPQAAAGGLPTPNLVWRRGGHTPSGLQSPDAAAAVGSPPTDGAALTKSILACLLVGQEDVSSCQTRRHNNLLVQLEHSPQWLNKKISCLAGQEDSSPFSEGRHALSFDKKSCPGPARRQVFLLSRRACLLVQAGCLLAEQEYTPSRPTKDIPFVQEEGTSSQQDKMSSG